MLMRCCQNRLFDKEIKTFIFVPLILRTWNEGAKTNEKSTRVCFFYLIFSIWLEFFLNQNDIIHEILQVNVRNVIFIRLQ